jgi:hypothetical protein
MGYSLLAIAEQEPNWKELHADVFNPDGPIEMFPIDEGDAKYYLGLNIPSSKLDKHSNTWEELEKTINALKSTYNFKVFDLYGGFYVDDQNLLEVKKQLIGV